MTDDTLIRGYDVVIPEDLRPALVDHLGGYADDSEAEGAALRRAMRTLETTGRFILADEGPDQGRCGNLAESVVEDLDDVRLIAAIESRPIEDVQAEWDRQVKMEKQWATRSAQRKRVSAECERMLQRRSWRGVDRLPRGRRFVFLMAKRRVS